MPRTLVDSHHDRGRLDPGDHALVIIYEHGIAYPDRWPGQRELARLRGVLTFEEHGMDAGAMEPLRHHQIAPSSSQAHSPQSPGDATG